jgi:carbamoyl-phosphate synthase small subunit
VKKATLVLEDGRSFAGRSFGADGEAIAEVVFNTSMTGYQEVLTDPSYAGQFVVMTVPHVGNYGVTPADEESARPFASGFLLREACPAPSNHRAEGDLPGYMRRHGLLGADGIDTRALTRHLRVRGAMMGIVSSEDHDEARLLAKVKAAPGMTGRDLVPEVSCGEPYEWCEPNLRTDASVRKIAAGEPAAEAGPRIAVIDCGIKRSTLRQLASLGARVTVVPARASAREVLALSPSGVLVSNGPGDPSAVTYVIATVRELLGQVPVFGICLGHQLLALALGARTYKLKFGHRGGNQPVRDLSTGRVLISSHNHGFTVDAATLPAGECEPWFVNLNDQTNEGLRCKSIPAMSVQFHPEAAPGPNDCRYLFSDWMNSLRSAGRAG